MKRERRSRVEAHISAEQALSQSYAWFSYPHEDERRPSRFEEASSEGQKEAFGLILIRGSDVYAETAKAKDPAKQADVPGGLPPWAFVGESLLGALCLSGNRVGKESGVCRREKTGECRDAQSTQKIDARKLSEKF